MADKVFKSLDELIELLKNRGVDINDDKSKQFAKTRLQQEGYYSLINGYKHLFLIHMVMFLYGYLIIYFL